MILTIFPAERPGDLRKNSTDGKEREMSIESEIFSKYVINKDALEAYGFKSEGESLVFRMLLPEDRLEIVLEYESELKGRIEDLESGGEYVNYRLQNAVGYSAEIRQKFEDLLLDVREKCSTDRCFKGEQTRKVCDHILTYYGVKPEFLWEKFPSFAAFRESKSQKWFALIGSVPRNKVDRSSSDHREVEVLNVKEPPEKVRLLLGRRGYYPAYHMNKKSWVSLILDGALPDEEVMERLDESRSNI